MMPGVLIEPSRYYLLEGEDGKQYKMRLRVEADGRVYAEPVEPQNIPPDDRSQLIRPRGEFR